MIVENIRKYAAEKKVSITELEKKAGLGNGTIGKWNTSIPRLDKIGAVAKCLGVTIEELTK